MNHDSSSYNDNFLERGKVINQNYSNMLLSNDGKPLKNLLSKQLEEADNLIGLINKMTQEEVKGIKDLCKHNKRIDDLAMGISLLSEKDIARITTYTDKALNRMWRKRDKEKVST